MIGRSDCRLSHCSALSSLMVAAENKPHMWKGMVGTELERWSHWGLAAWDQGQPCNFHRGKRGVQGHFTTDPISFSTSERDRRGSSLTTKKAMLGIMGNAWMKVICDRDSSKKEDWDWVQRLTESNLIFIRTEKLHCPTQHTLILGWVRGITTITDSSGSVECLTQGLRHFKSSLRLDLKHTFTAFQP